MKTTIVLLSLSLLTLTGFAASPIELIRGLGDDLLEDYSRPLVESYGVAMGTGWYHSARPLRTLRLEIGARLMMVNIPENARTFSARVLACSVNTATQKVDTFYVTVEGAATIFGPRGSSPVPLDENAIAVPPALPGGLGINWMPFIVPQASVGLPFGLELTARYVPWPFEGTTVSFLGVGAKKGFSSPLGIPLDFAVQGFYQRFDIGSEFNSVTWGGNIHVSRSLLLFAPYAGLGLDKSNTSVDYIFRATVPTGIEGGRLRTEEIDIPVQADYERPVSIRGTLGVALRFGLMLVNADYNYNLSTGYHAASLGVGASFR